MFVKICGGILLLGFLFIQSVKSLECYSCQSEPNCKSPKKITCDLGKSDVTNIFLNQYFQRNGTSLTSTSDFGCISISVNYKLYTPVLLNDVYSGCINHPDPVCELSPKPGVTKTKCLKCLSNLCNTAGSYSSSVFTIVASIIAMAVFYKTL